MEEMLSAKPTVHGWHWGEAVLAPCPSPGSCWQVLVPAQTLLLHPKPMAPTAAKGLCSSVVVFFSCGCNAYTPFPPYPLRRWPLYITHVSHRR